MKHLWILGAVLSVGGLGVDAWAKSAQEIEQEVRTAIQQRHPTDTPDWWRGLGPEAPGVLISLFQSSTKIYEKVRLLDALAWFDDPVATEFLKKQVRETNESALKMSALRSVGVSQGAEQADFLSRYLNDRDPQVRIVAARAIQTAAQNGDERSKAHLEAYRKNENTMWVLNRLDGKTPAPPRSKTFRMVASTGSHVDDQFIGYWKGQWLVPGQKVGSLNSLPVWFIVEKDKRTKVVTGRLDVIRSGNQTLKRDFTLFQMKNLASKKKKLTGQFRIPTELGLSQYLGKFAGKENAGKEIAFEATLRGKKDHQQLLLEVPDLGAVLVVIQAPTQR